MFVVFKRASVLLLLLVCGSLQAAQTNLKGALLQTEIRPVPVNNVQSTPGRVLPGTTVQLMAKVTNVGDVASAPGEFLIRFALPKPLDRQPNSVIYKTETVALPSIKPGDSVSFEFSKFHQWPSLFDFVRGDWAMREYEAVALIEEKEHITGTLVISFSAFYYEGPSEKKPARVSSLGQDPLWRKKFGVNRQLSN